MNKIFQSPLMCIFISPLIFMLSCNSPPSNQPIEKVKRYGSVIGLREEKLDEYKKLHIAVWPEVSNIIRECNIRNYSIYLKRLDDGKYYLFSYFEYTGNEFKADMARMAADTTTQRWWRITDPCQQPLTDRISDEWWASMEEVFHQD